MTDEIVLDVCPVCRGRGIVKKEVRYTKAGKIAVRLKQKRPHFGWTEACPKCDGTDIWADPDQPGCFGYVERGQG